MTNYDKIKILSKKDLILIESYKNTKKILEELKVDVNQFVDYNKYYKIREAIADILFEKNIVCKI